MLNEKIVDKFELDRAAPAVLEGGWMAKLLQTAVGEGLYLIQEAVVVLAVVLTGLQ